jgi:phosphopantothenoylcysteine decarboxylase/phosphopantothenate--cysteine ligase
VRFVVTAGPTREFIDPVRFLSNPSTGRMGFAVARAARAAGHEVTLIAGPVALKTPRGVRRVDVVSARDMLAAVQAELKTVAQERDPPPAGAAALVAAETPTVLVMTAAVADWRPARRAVRKLKKSEMSGTLRLVRNPDILKTINRQLGGPRSRAAARLIRIGFAAETGAPAAEAVRKCREKELDLVVGNDVTARGSGFGTATNRVTFVTPDGRVQHLPLMSKLAVARRIVSFAESAVVGRPPYQPVAAQRKGADA